MTKKITQLAPSVNAYRVKFDPELLAELRFSYESCVEPAIRNGLEGRLLDAGTQFRRVLSGSDAAYFIVSFGAYPLGWISANTQEVYCLFHKFFDAIKVEDDARALIDHHSRLILYCGFFVVGRHAASPKWHVDYLPGSNAFTLLTPLYNWNPAHGHLMFMDRGWPRRYLYQYGEAILFGEGFVHSTAPYAHVGNERVLLSLTFGTDKMQYWSNLSNTIGSQSRCFRLPSGMWTEKSE